MYCDTPDSGAVDDCAAIVLNELKELIANVTEVASIAVPKTEPPAVVSKPDQTSESTKCTEGFCSTTWKPHSRI